MGTVAKVRQILKLQNEVVRVMIEGESRGKLCDMLEEKNYMVASVSILKEEKKEATSKKDLALLRKIHEAFSIYAGIAGNVSDSVAVNVLDNKDIGGVCDYICQNISLPIEHKQIILEQTDPNKRGEELIRIITEEIDIIDLENRIQDKVKYGIDKHQRDYYLKEQIKVINEELGEGEDTVSESLEYKNKILSLKLPEASEKKRLKEASSLAKMYTNAPECGVVRN